MAAGEPGDLAARAARMRDLIGELTREALAFLPQGRLQEMARHWLADAADHEDAAEAGRASADALSFAVAVAMFSPSAAGTTAIDRLARQAGRRSPEEKAALAALQRAAFRILRIEEPDPLGGYRVVDLATGERFHLVDPQVPQGCQGLHVATRLAVVEGEAVITAGPITPLDDAALAVAEARMRPGGRGLTNPNRCAEAIYRHVVRFGTIEVPGLNRSAGEDGPDLPFGPDDGPLHALAFAIEDGQEPDPEAVQEIRELVSAETVMQVLIGIAAARDGGRPALAAAYERIGLVQLETVERRAASGMGARFASVQTLAAMVDAAVGEGIVPVAIKEVFEELRRRMGVAAGRGDRAGLDRVLARIQALRAKTVDRGCTEEEAIAAARKVAELLDRHGLSLSEVELKGQACEGFGVDTGRRRLGPIDRCIPSVGLFCDCRVWAEKAADGELRYIFFGLPADVAGARYLYELVARAFETETLRFKRGELYAEHHTGDRRTATSSFQIGLADGIARKLTLLREQRDAAMRAATGRELIPLKEGVIEDELAKLGLRFRAHDERSRRVLRDAYEAGQEAGERFEHRPGIEERAAQGSSTIPP